MSDLINATDLAHIIQRAQEDIRHLKPQYKSGARHSLTMIRSQCITFFSHENSNFDVDKWLLEAQ